MLMDSESLWCEGYTCQEQHLPCHWRFSQLLLTCPSQAEIPSEGTENMPRAFQNSPFFTFSGPKVSVQKGALK